MFYLIINSGSSSLKFKVFDQKLKTKISGIVEKIGLPGSFIVIDRGLKKQKKEFIIKNHDQALQNVMLFLHEISFNIKLIKKVGHRVVHGGEEFIKPTLITRKEINKLKKYNKFAPLHNPNNLAGIKACLRVLPWAKNYAVFDTAFHQTLPDYAYMYALPYKFYQKQHVRRYGFHGLSHEYLTEQAAKLLKKKINKVNLITCHLGSGASITAVKKGQSIDTSMGFTPLEGLMMSTRAGDLDPAIPLYLLQKGKSIAEINKIFNFESGVLGVSGMKDMRDVLVANGYKIKDYKSKVKYNLQQKKLAMLALKMFIYRIRKYIGAYSVVLGKVDAIVFSGGIGERNRDVRKLILKKLNVKAKTLVVKTDEEKMICELIK